MDLSPALAVLAITIDIHPDIGTIFGVKLTWHGLFTALGIVAGVLLAVRLARADGVPSEMAQEVALVSVVSAIVGARLFYVFEHWDMFGNDLAGIVVDITEGGITLYGGLIGGVLGGLVYGLIRRLPIAITLDAAAPGMILGQGVGRIGDLINGEHLATPSDLPWAVVYAHPETLGKGPWLGASVHPTAGGYELLGDFLILAILLFVGRRFIKVPGWTFCLYMALYSVMRFGLSELRVDEQTLGGAPVPQLVAAVVLGLSFVLLGVLRRWPGPVTPEWEDRVLGPPPDAGPDAGDDEPAPARP